MTLTAPPAFHVCASQSSGSSRSSNSWRTAGWSWTSPSAPAPDAPANVPLWVPAAKSALRLSTSVPGGVVNDAGAELVAGLVVLLPAASTDVTR